MVQPVKRWQGILIRVLVMAQLLTAAPLALAQPAPESAGAMPCAEMMNMADGAAGTDECPCCPEGADSVAACLSACVAAAGMPPSFTLSLARAEKPRVCLPIVIAHSRVSDPPTKPPPIV